METPSEKKEYLPPSTSGTRRGARWIAAGTYLLVFAWPATLPAAENTDEGRCVLEAGPRHAVERVVDGETIVLDDGQEVRLIGALAPRRLKREGGSPPWKPEQDAIAALDSLVLGRSVELAFSERRRDRYGRLLAHVFLERDGRRVWVQGDLLSRGHARAYGLPGNFACMNELLAHEAVAREAGIGLWSNAAYDTRSADFPRQLMRLRNTYQIIEGTVVDVAPTKSGLFLNFSEDWKTDLTVGVSRKVQRAHPEWAETLSALKAKHVRMRGWITYRNGPYVEIRDPSQIEIVQDDLKGPTERSSGPTMSKGEGEDDQSKENRPAHSEPGGVDL